VGITLDVLGGQLSAINYTMELLKLCGHQNYVLILKISYGICADLHHIGGPTHVYCNHWWLLGNLARMEQLPA